MAKKRAKAPSTYTGSIDYLPQQTPEQMINAELELQMVRPQVDPYINGITFSQPDYGPPPAQDDGSGAPSGGGGGGFMEFAPPPPRPKLAESPEWMAFLNSLGLEQGQFEADIGRQRGVARGLAAQQEADITAAGPGQRRQIAGSLETRGMARSGQFIQALAEQRAQEGRKKGQVQGSLTGTLSGLESNLAQKLIDIGSKRAQQELQLRAQGYE